MPYRTHSSRRGTRDKLVSTQDHDFPDYYRCAREAHEGDPNPQGIHCWPQTTPKCTHARDHIDTYANTHSKSKKSCCDRIQTPQQNIMPEFRNACLQEYAKDALIGSFPFPPKILFCKNTQIQIFQTQYQKLSQIFLK